MESKIISVMNQKGGVGKTTMAANLAAGLKQKDRSVILIDADGQASALDWYNASEKPPVEVIPLDTTPLLKAGLKDITAQGYDYVVVDCPPQVKTAPDLLLDLANLAVIVATPSPLDIWASNSIVEMIREKQARRPDLMARFLINRVIPNTNIGREIKDTLQEFNITAFDTVINQRVVYPVSIINGQSVYNSGNKSAIAEIDSFTNEVIEILEGV